MTQENPSKGERWLLDESHGDTHLYGLIMLKEGMMDNQVRITRQTGDHPSDEEKQEILTLSAQITAARNLLTGENIDVGPISDDPERRLPRRET